MQQEQEKKNLYALSVINRISTNVKVFGVFNKVLVNRCSQSLKTKLQHLRTLKKVDFSKVFNIFQPSTFFCNLLPSTEL